MVFVESLSLGKSDLIDDTVILDFWDYLELNRVSVHVDGMLERG